MYCIYLSISLGKTIELSQNRFNHILDRHLELKAFLYEFDITIARPDLVLQKDTGEILFIKWFDNVLSGKFITVVVICDELLNRNWVITAFITRSCPKGKLYE